MTLANAASSASVAFPLDEASGSAIDAVGSLDLTETSGTIASAAGVYSTARDFEVDDTEYFTRADDAAFSMGDIAFTIRAWVNLESNGSSAIAVGKWDVGTHEYLLFFRSNDRFSWAVSHDGATTAIQDADNFGSVPTGTWCLLHAWHDPTANEIGISVNGGTANTLSHSAGVLDSTSAFILGANGDAGPAQWWDGLLSDVVVLKSRVLDATERALDYQGGGGIPFSHWTDTNDLVALTPTAHFDASDADRLFTTYAATGIHTTAPSDGSAVQVWDNEYASTSIADLAFVHVNMPDYRSGGSATMKSGLSELDFNGSSDYMIAYNQKGTVEKTWADFLDLDGWCLFGSFRADTGGITANQTGNNRYLNHILTGDDTATLALYLRSGGGSPKLGFVAAVGAAYTASLEVDVSENTTYYYILRYDGTDYKLSVNGGTEASITAGQIDSLAGDVRIGFGHASSSLFAGRFGEWGAFDYSPSAGNVTTLETYLDRWLTATFTTFPYPRGMDAGMALADGGVSA